MKTLTKISSVLALAVTAWTTPATLQAAEAPAAPPANGDGPPAQTEMAPAPRPRMQHFLDRRMEYLDQNLKLTAEQKAQIKAIWDKTGQQMRDLRKDEQAERMAQRHRMREIMKQDRKQVRGVLTADQQKIFDSLPPQDRPERRGPRREPPEAN